MVGSTAAASYKGWLKAKKIVDSSLPLSGQLPPHPHLLHDLPWWGWGWWYLKTKIGFTIFHLTTSIGNNWRAGLINLKFFMKTQEVSRKKTSQNIFYQRSPSLSKCNLKYENICLLNCSSPNIWAVVYIIVFNSSPHVLYFYIAAIVLKSPAKYTESQNLNSWCVEVILAPKIYWNWNWTKYSAQICCLK